jgi:hypothetical protein
MAQEDGITRRVAAGRKPDSYAVDSADGSNVFTSARGSQQWLKRRRRGLVSKQSTFSMLKRRVALILHRKSDRATSIIVAAIAGILLLVCCWPAAQSVRKLREKAFNLHPALIASKPNARGSHARDNSEFELLYKNGLANLNRISNHVLNLPKERKKEFANAKTTPDYGRLDFQLLEKTDVERRIFLDDYQYVTDFRHPDTPEDDDIGAYYAFDDDYIKAGYGVAADDHYQDKVCRRVMVHKLHFPNCNSFHELPMLEHDVKYLNEGSFRQVVALRHSFGKLWEIFTIKDIQYE